eukprot:14608206-Alexandrium_andersonii.AAC.1
MSASLVGSEMCIRDRFRGVSEHQKLPGPGFLGRRRPPGGVAGLRREVEAVSYTHLTLPTICSV